MGHGQSGEHRPVPEGEWRHCRGRDEDEGHKPGGCQTQEAPRLSWSSHPPLAKGLSSPQPHGGVRQFCCFVPIPTSTSACCAPVPGPRTPHCGAWHRQCCSLSWDTSRDLGQDTAEEAVRLLLSQQDLGQGKAAGPGCSQISPTISCGFQDRKFLIPHTASFKENGTRSLQGCSHIAETF